MKNEKLKIVVLVIISIFLFIGIVAESITTLQLLPFLLYFVLVGLDYMKKNISIYMLVLSGFMAFLNLAVFSPIDIFFWAIVIGLYL